jgi:large subunit ribosomal protein L4
MTIKKTIKILNKTINEKDSQNQSIELNLTLPNSYNSENIQIKSNYLIYRALKKQQFNQRQGTINTKTRSEVRGGGRKPWKQKGTGRARAGSTRSPLWRGGGVIFGPKPKKFKQKMNQKEWQLCLKLLLINKSKNITVIEFSNKNFSKTKDILNLIENFIPTPFRRVLIITPEFNKDFYRVTKNLKNIQLLQANCLNIRDILIAQHILVSKETLKIIEETYNGLCSKKISEY